MSEHKDFIRHIHLTEPLAGLEEEYEAARETYVLEKAEELLGLAGKMISASKTGFCRRHPDHFRVSTPTSAPTLARSGSATST